MEHTDDGIHFKKAHAYYFQAQFSAHCLFIFIVWTPKGLHTEQIDPCPEFFKTAVENQIYFLL